MAQINSRKKGQRGEREVIELLQPIVDKVCQLTSHPRIVLERNLMQASLGGFDITGLDWFGIEVKNCATLSLDKWWEQTCAQARAHAHKRRNLKCEPVLFYKIPRRAWRVMLYVYLPTPSSRRHGHWTTAQIEVDAFLAYFNDRLEAELMR
jgi:hypothetical protein